MTAIPKTSGIYQITCTITGKFYIGSSKNLYNRYYGHIGALKRNDHGNNHLQNAWNKYGEDAFTFEVLELTLPDFQIEREQYWLDKLKPWGKKGFNINQFANGSTHAPESRMKLSKALMGNKNGLGKIPSAEKRAKIGNAHRGREHTPEQIEKHRQAMNGRVYDTEVYTNRRGTYIITSPDGIEHIVNDLRKFCKDHSLNNAHIIQVAKGNALQHKGWIARYANDQPVRKPTTNIRKPNNPESHASQMITLIVTSPTGEVYTVNGIRQFCREHNLDISSLVGVAKGQRKQHKGYTASYP